MSKTKTIRCPGPPEHDFEFTQTGRGRPPRYCDEHKPVRKSPATATPENGRSSDTPESENPFIKKHRNREKAAPMIAKNEAERERKAKSVQDDLEEEWGAIADRETAAYAYYDKLFEKGKNSNDDKLWNSMSAAQNSCIAVSRRKRELDAYFEAITNGETPRHIPEPRTGTSPIGTIRPERNVEPVTATAGAVAATPYLNDEPDLEDADLDEGSDLPINDLLSNPDQFDGPFEDFGELIDGELTT